MEMALKVEQVRENLQKKSQREITFVHLKT